MMNFESLSQCTAWTWAHLPFHYGHISFNSAKQVWQDSAKFLPWSHLAISTGHYPCQFSVASRSSRQPKEALTFGDFTGLYLRSWAGRALSNAMQTSLSTCPFSICAGGSVVSNEGSGAEERLENGKSSSSKYLLSWGTSWLSSSRCDDRPTASYLSHLPKKH